MTPTIRAATPADVRALADAVAGQPLMVRYGTTAERLARDLEAGLLRGDGVIVAEVAGRPLGLAWYLPTGTFAFGAYLRLIALRPGEEGRGLGALLLDEVERRAAATSRALFLLVSDWNAGARRFYSARGYAEVGVLSRFVLPDTDEVVCMKDLRQNAASK
jgi:GNAT superfamily N-acetyltransferase